MTSVVCAVLAPFAAYVVVDSMFPEPPPPGSDGGINLMTGVLGVYALMAGAGALFLGSIVGATAGIVSLVRSEPSRRLAWAAMAVNGVVVTGIIVLVWIVRHHA